MCKKLQIVVMVAAMAAVSISTALAQQKGQRGRGGFGLGGQTATLLTVAATEAVQKDLGISSDTAGKLTALRDEYRAASQKENEAAGINFQNFQNQSNEERQRNAEKMATIATKLNDEFNPKVKDLVSADQYKRLQQIQLQANLQFVGPTVLIGQLASELKITDDQKQKLEGIRDEFAAKQRDLFTGGNVDQQAMTKLRQERADKTLAVLTAEQKQRLDSLTGSKFDVSQINVFGGFGGRRGKN